MAAFANKNIGTAIPASVMMISTASGPLPRTVQLPLNVYSTASLPPAVGAVRINTDGSVLTFDGQRWVDGYGTGPSDLTRPIGYIDLANQRVWNGVRWVDQQELVNAANDGRVRELLEPREPYRREPPKLEGSGWSGDVWGGLDMSAAESKDQR